MTGKPERRVMPCEPLTGTARVVREQGDLLHLFYVRQRPTLVEVRFERAIKSEQGKPCLAGHGGNPVLLETFRRGRREVNVHRAVTVFCEIRKTRRTIHNLLLVLDEAARVQVIERNRPELLGGRIWRNMQTVSRGAVERVALFVPVDVEVSMAPAGCLGHHACTGPNGFVSVARAFVELAVSSHVLLRGK